MPASGDGERSCGHDRAARAREDRRGSNLSLALEVETVGADGHSGGVRKET